MSSPVRTIEIAVALPWDRDTEPDGPALGRDLRLLWIIEEVRQRRLGVGKASELAEMPRAAFMRALGEHGVPVIDYSVEDLDRELSAGLTVDELLASRLSPRPGVGPVTLADMEEAIAEGARARGGITKDTSLEIKMDTEALIIQPAKLGENERIRESTTRMMAVHDETLRKLAK